MKKIFLTLMIFGLYFSANLYSQTQVFEVVNNTGQTITGVYMSAATVYKFDSNMLTKDKLMPNESFTFSMPVDDRSCTFDFKYMTEDKTNYMRSSINLCQEKNIAFTKTDKTYDEHIKTQYEK